MSNTHYFLTPVSHRSGEGYTYATVCVDISRLDKVVKAASAALANVCPADSNLWGDLTARGLCSGVLFDSYEGEEMERLCDLASRDDEGDDAPIEITEEQFNAFGAMEDAMSFEHAGFSIQVSVFREDPDRVFLSAYPRKGDGEAVSTKDFAFVLPTPAAASS